MKLQVLQRRRTNANNHHRLDAEFFFSFSYFAQPFVVIVGIMRLGEPLAPSICLAGRRLSLPLNVLFFVVVVVVVVTVEMVKMGAIPGNLGQKRVRTNDFKKEASASCSAALSHAPPV